MRNKVVERRPALKWVPILCAPQQGGEGSVKSRLRWKHKAATLLPIFTGKREDIWVGSPHGAAKRSPLPPFPCMQPSSSEPAPAAAVEAILLRPATCAPRARPSPAGASGAQAASFRAPHPSPSMVVVSDEPAAPRLRICWRAGPALPAPGCEQAASSDVSQAAQGVCSEEGMFFLSRPIPFQSPAFPSQPYDSLPNIFFPSAVFSFFRVFASP